MPLFELFRLTKAKLESSQETKSSFPEDEVVELVWENGQIATQSQSSKSSSPLPTLQSNSQVTKEIGNGPDAKMNGAVSKIQAQVPVPSVDMGLGQDEDMVRWLGYPLYEPWQETAYCADFLPNVSEITANERENENDVPSQTAFPCCYRRDSGNQSLGNSDVVSACNDLSVGQGTSSNVPTKEAARSDSNLFQANSANPLAVCERSSHTTASVGCFTHTQDPLLPDNKAGLINFSHFLRPTALAKANLRGMGAQSISKIGGADNRAAVTVSGSTPLETQLVELDSNRLREEKSPCYPFTASASKVGVAKQEEDKVFNESVASGLPNFVGMASSSENNQKACLSFGDTSRRDPESEKTVETLVACSSVCSGNNSLEGPSDDPLHGTKRKHSDTQDVECYSEDIEEESTDARKTAPSRVGSGSKRSRSAEVHNLSERRRRDRINEKMRALQELIPNCNKVDKASMLDEAIEYLKTLQVQVQIMSMGSGYYMPPIMLPLGMQHMHAAHIGHYPPMGVNYGMGMPNMSGSLPRGPMVHVPPMPGSQFQGPMAMHGRSESMFQPLIHHSQGVPVAMPHVGGGFFMSSPMEVSGYGVVEPMKNMEATKESSCKEPEKSSVSQATQSSNGANIPTKQASYQVGRSI